MNKRVHIIVYGKVQGVFYRSSTCDQAINLSLTGWARNKPEGTVEIIAEGSEENLNKLIKWCRIGPPMATVSEVSTTWLEYKKEFRRFEIKI